LQQKQRRPRVYRAPGSGGAAPLRARAPGARSGRSGRSGQRSGGRPRRAAPACYEPPGRTGVQPLPSTTVRHWQAPVLFNRASAIWPDPAMAGGPSAAPAAALEWSVDLDAGDARVCGLAWCPGTGLLAAATQRRPGAACADVALIEPHDPSRAARLQAPLAGARGRRGGGGGGRGAPWRGQAAALAARARGRWSRAAAAPRAQEPPPHPPPHPLVQGPLTASWRSSGRRAAAAACCSPRAAAAR
jgi:hypothetical protein